MFDVGQLYNPYSSGVDLCTATKAEDIKSACVLEDPVAFWNELYEQASVPMCTRYDISADNTLFSFTINSEQGFSKDELRSIAQRYLELRKQAGSPSWEEDFIIAAFEESAVPGVPTIINIRINSELGESVVLENGEKSFSIGTGTEHLKLAYDAFGVDCSSVQANTQPEVVSVSPQGAVEDPTLGERPSIEANQSDYSSGMSEQATIPIPDAVISFLCILSILGGGVGFVGVKYLSDEANRVARSREHGTISLGKGGEGTPKPAKGHTSSVSASTITKDVEDSPYNEAQVHKFWSDRNKRRKETCKAGFAIEEKERIFKNRGAALMNKKK